MNRATSPTLWINARFIDRPITGVERVAREMIGALADNFLDPAGRWEVPDGTLWKVRLIAPRDGTTRSPWAKLPLLRAGKLAGHLWEQVDLPRLTRGEWLFSPCNTAPLFKRKHILFLHDAQPFAIPRNFTWAFRTWYRILYTVAGANAAALLTNSEFSKRELVRCIGLRERKMRVCLLGSEHALRLEPDANTLERFDLPLGPFVLAVSSPSPNKNFAAVVRALEMLGENAPPCVIVGQENTKIFSGTRIERTRVRHLGYVSDVELAALYQRAMVLAFPSFYEGFGLPPLEAMARGCPVIVSRTTSMPEVGGDAAIYCDPADPATLASAIARIAHKHSLQAELSRLGRQRAATFSWSSAAAILLDTLAVQTAGADT